MTTELRHFLRDNLPPLTTRQLTLISLGLGALIALVTLFTGVNYRTSILGLLAVGAVGGVIAAVAIALRPELGAYLLVFSIFTNISTVSTNLGGPSINKPLVGLVFVSVMINRIIIKKEKIAFRRVEYAMLAYVIAMTLSMVFATNRVEAMAEVVNIAKEFVIVVTLVFALKTPRHWQNALWIMMLAAAFLATLSAYQIITGNYSNEFYGLAVWRTDSLGDTADIIRIAGPGLDTNFYAQSLLAIVPLALYRVLDDRHVLLKLLGIGIAGLLLFAVMNTYSRGAFLVIGLLAITIAIERKIKPHNLAVLFILGGLLLPFMPASYLDRMSSLVGLTEENTSGQQDESFKGRTSEILSGLLMFQSHPIFGVGAGNYEEVYQEYAQRIGMETRTEEREAHSYYVEVAAETGMAGLFTFLLIFFIAETRMATNVRAMKKLDLDPVFRAWIISVMIALMSYLTTSLFLHGDYNRYLWLLVAMAAAAVHISSDMIKYAQPAQPAPPPDAAAAPHAQPTSG